MSDAREKLLEVMKAGAIAAGTGEPSWADCVSDAEWEAALSALEAAGVRLVPVNMTDEQMIAAERAVQASMDRGESAPIRFAALSVSAMLAASPYAQKDETND